MKFRTIVFLVITTTLFLSLGHITPAHAIPIKRDDGDDCNGNLKIDFDTFEEAYFRVVAKWYNVKNLDYSQPKIDGSYEGLTFKCSLYQGSNGDKERHTFEEFKTGVKACRKMLKSFWRIEQGRSEKNAGSPCTRSDNNDVVSLEVY
ncbi:MAG: hypothetical protein J3Q66DRAFT_393971 [Benniella sp.]|nr:MAG: hypothetical protein J3Q66DRAFT_393971 [Benniella sp.]